MKKIIRITESDVSRIFKQVIKETINEIDKDSALCPMTIYSLTDRLTNDGKYSSINKNGNHVNINRVNIKSRKISDRAIMNYVIQDMEPWLSFKTSDKTHPNGNVGIEFEIKEIKEYTETEMQLYGYIVTANWKGYDKKHGIIKCVFGDEGKNSSSSNFRFYLVENIGNSIRTPEIKLLGDPNNETTIRTIIDKIYNLRKEAITNVEDISDLSSFNLNGNLNIKSKKTCKKNS